MGESDGDLLGDFMKQLPAIGLNHSAGKERIRGRDSGDGGKQKKFEIVPNGETGAVVGGRNAEEELFVDEVSPS